MKTKYLILISVLVSTMTFAQLTSVSPNQAAQGQTLSLLVSGNIGWTSASASVAGGICFPYFKLIEDDAAGGGAGNDVVGTITSPGNIDISIPAFQPIGPYDVEVRSCLNGASTIYTMPNSFYIGTATSIDEQATQKELLIVTDLLGRKTKTPTKNEPFLHIYNDGTVEKRIVIE